MLFLLILSTYGIILNVVFVKAAPPIYIRANGNVEGTANLLSSDNDTYTFVADISGSIVVERSNIIIDGKGYSLQGMATGDGFSLSSVNNVIIKNTNIRYFADGSGITLSNSSDNYITANNITDNRYGILLSDSSNSNTVVANKITHNGVVSDYTLNGVGIDISWSSNNNNITANSITNNGYCGVSFYVTDYNTLAANNITANHGDAIGLSVSSNNNIAGNNLAENTGKALSLDEKSNYTSVTANNMTRNTQGISIYSSHNSIIGNNVTESDTGIFFYYYSSYNTITANNITNNEFDGIEIYKWSDYHTIAENNITNNGRDGISSISDYTNITANNITANNRYGMKLSALSNNITANNIEANVAGGLQLTVSQNTIAANNVTANNADGIWFEQNSNDNNVTANNIQANKGDGIFFSYWSKRNIIAENRFTANSGDGVELSGTRNNTIVGNIFVENGLVVEAIDNVVLYNLVNGKPLVYLEHASDIVVEDAGQVILVECNGITVENLNLSNTAVGVQLYNTTNTTVTNNNIANNHRGIWLNYNSNYNLIAANRILTNDEYGIQVSSSTDSTIIMNDVVNNQNYGILIDGLSSNSVIIANNIIANNGTGLQLSSSNNVTLNLVASNEEGIITYGDRNNIIANDITTNNKSGIQILSSQNNIIASNNITSNGNGIELSSSHNALFHNNFINNTKQAAPYPGYSNIWDAGYPTGGNYWSDYVGVDINNDGIGDSAHVIDTNNVDWYPPMNLFLLYEHELVTSMTTPSSAWVGNSSTIDVTVTNQGINSESNVQILLLINGTVTNSTTIPVLDASDSYTLSYSWIPPAEGSYNVAVLAQPALGETSLQNNNVTKFVTARVGDPMFDFALMVPGLDPARQAYAEIVKNNLDAVGINATIVYADWNSAYERALTPDAATLGKTYDQGGFDSLFIGYATTMDPEPFSFYDSSQFPPGGNYYLWENSENDRLCRLIETTTDEATRLQYVREWQQLAYSEQPSATLFYSKEVVAFDPTALQGEPFEAYHYPSWLRAKNWKLNPNTNQTQIVLAQTGPAPVDGLNPLLTTLYYDLTVYDNVFDSLAERNDTITKNILPGLATSWSVAPDNKTWTVNLRTDVKWHDGVAFTADDVKFTFDSCLSYEVGSPFRSYVGSILGSSSNIEVVDSYTVLFHLPNQYAYFVESILTTPIIPKHVLESVPPTNWKTHPFNAASGSYTVSTPGIGTGSYTAYGPIGTGPYIYARYWPSNQTNQLVKNPNYWNAPVLEAAGAFGIQELYIQCIASPDLAIATLKAGDVDVLDAQYHLETRLANIQQPWGSYVSYDGFGVQELGFNMQHPVFGTGISTPLGMADPSRAAEAARYVRKAISHLIPRQQIIDTIMAGYGSPGVTTPLTKATVGFDSSLQPYSYNVSLAKAWLAAAGYNTGVPPIPEIPSPLLLVVCLMATFVLVMLFGKDLGKKVSPK